MTQSTEQSGNEPTSGDTNNVPKRPVGAALGIGIFLIPIVFSWFTLGKGRTVLAKSIAFSWLAFSLFAFVAIPQMDKANQNLRISAGTANDPSLAAAKANENMSRGYLKALLEGKSTTEVISLIGRPDTTQGFGEYQNWSYPGITYDEVTGKYDYSATITFGPNNRVSTVMFF